jgi:hypothetical protein
VSDARAVALTKLALEAITSSSLPDDYDFTPERSYAEWDMQVAESDGLRVDVVLNTVEQKVDAQTRQGLKYEVPVDIAIRQRLGSDKQDLDTGRIAIEHIDNLMKLVEDIHLLYLRSKPDDGSVWHDTKIFVAPLKHHLREFRQFTAIIRVTFWVTVKDQ